MWSTALSLLTSVIGTSWFKPLAIALGCVASAWLGYSYSAHSYEAQIASIRQEMASATAQMEKENAQRLSKAIEERDTANNRLSALVRSNSDLLARVRNANDSETKRAPDYSKDIIVERYERCRQLLLRGNELAERGCRLAQGCANNHKALSDVVK